MPEVKPGLRAGEFEILGPEDDRFPAGFAVVDDGPFLLFDEVAVDPLAGSDVESSDLSLHPDREDIGVARGESETRASRERKVTVLAGIEVQDVEGTDVRVRTVLDGNPGKQVGTIVLRTFRKEGQLGISGAEYDACFGLEHGRGREFRSGKGVSRSARRPRDQSRTVPAERPGQP